MALMPFMIFLKSTSSCAVHGSDFADKSTFFGSLISPIFLAFKVLCNEPYCCTCLYKHAKYTKMDSMKLGDCCFSESGIHMLLVACSLPLLISYSNFYAFYVCNCAREHISYSQYLFSPTFVCRNILGAIF